MGELAGPPFRGIVESTQDALLLLEAARRGIIPRVSRRFTEKERALIQSGAIFIFHEEESKIKRWTDGLVWSPSRILGNFLIYRELEKRDRSGEVRPFSSQGESQTSPNGLVATIDGANADSLSPTEKRERKLRERQLVGSLTASFRFKEKGLIKKTMSMSINGYSQHLISYYSLEDALAGRLRAPSTLPELSSLEIGSEFLDPEQFRFPPKTQVGPDGHRRYRGEPDMQDETPEESTTPLPSPSVVTLAGASPSASKLASYVSPPEGSAAEWTSSQASTSRARPSSSGIPSARRVSSPPTYVSGSSSGSYPSRTGRMYHPYAAGPADTGDASIARHLDGGRRPSLRGQYSFDSGPVEKGRPMSSPYPSGPSPVEHAPYPAINYSAQPNYYLPPSSAPPYAGAPPPSSYHQAPAAAYPFTSPYHPTPYDAYVPVLHPAPPPSQPTYYEDSPLHSPIERKPQVHHYAPAPPLQPAYYHPPPPAPAPLPLQSQDYTPIYPPSELHSSAPLQPIPRHAPAPQHLYSSYAEPSSSTGPPPPPPARPSIYGSPYDGQQQPEHAAGPYHHPQAGLHPAATHALPPGQPAECQPPYTGWGYGEDAF